jgi:hypothetical protein
MKENTTCSNVEQSEEKICKLMEQKRTEIEALKKILHAFETEKKKIKK